MVQFVATHNQQDRNSLSSSMSIPSSCDGISLSSAISEELKKRAEVREILYFFYLGGFEIFTDYFCRKLKRNQTAKRGQQNQVIFVKI